MSQDELSFGAEGFDAGAFDSGDQISLAQQVGRTLREARERAGMQIQDVANNLKLTLRQVEAIELGLLERLPGGQFTRGFVRNYARLVNVDAAPLLAKLEAAERVEAQPSLAGMATGPRMPAERRKRPRDNSILPALVLALGLFLLVAAGAYFHWFASPDESLLKQTLPAPPVAQGESQSLNQLPLSAPTPLAQIATPNAAQPIAPPAATAGASTVPIVPAEAAAPVVPAQTAAGTRQPADQAQSETSADAPQTAKAVAGDQLVFNFAENAWVEVKDATGQIIFSRLNEAGSTQEVRGQAPFHLVVGNAGKVSVRYKGAPVDLTPYIKTDVARLDLQ